MSKHTPGPWAVCGGYTPAYTAINSALDGYIVFSMADNKQHEENGRKITAPDYETQRANAKLIAVVPEMLEALLEAKKALESCYDVVDYPADGQSEQDKAIYTINDILDRLEGGVE